MGTTHFPTFSWIFAAVVVIFSIFSNCAASAEGDALRIYNWEDYLHHSVTDAFTVKTGIQVEQSYYVSDEQRDRRMFAGLDNIFDILIVDNARLIAYGEAGLVEDLSRYRIRNKVNVDSRWQKACGRFGVPFAWGLQGIAYRHTQLDSPVTSWRQLLEPVDELKGHIYINDDAIELFAMALSALEADPNTDDEETLVKAYHLLRKQKPYVHAYGQGSQLEDALDNIKAMSIYGGEFLQIFGSEPNGEWQFNYPDEGSTIWVDCLAITANSQHKRSAAAFIDFFLQPEYQALNTTHNLHTPVVSGVEAYLDNRLLRNPILFPDPIVLFKSPVETIVSHDSIRQRQRMAASLMIGKKLDN